MTGTKPSIKKSAEEATNDLLYGAQSPILSMAHSFLLEKPNESIAREEMMRDGMIQQGIEPAVANAIVGYGPHDVPFIYKIAPHEVGLQVQSKDTGEFGLAPCLSELWIGTSDAIYNLATARGVTDQIPEVIVQWRRYLVADSRYGPASDSITRDEVRQLGDGRFLKVSYKNVSTMGAFDGDMGNAVYLCVPNGTVKYGQHPEHQSFLNYRITQVPATGADGQPSSDEGTTFVLKSAGTTRTILNGFQEMITLDMDSISPIKEDFDRAIRYSELPQPSPQMQSTLPEPRDSKTLATSTAISDGAASEATALMRLVAPHILSQLAIGQYSQDAAQMSIDGILNYPERISILGRNLSTATRKQRFELACFVAKLIKNGDFNKWAQSLQENDSAGIVEDVIIRNTDQLLDWFNRTAPAHATLRGFLDAARESASNKQSLFRCENRNNSHQYERISDGMVCSFVERFVEYLGQQCLGRSLE